MLDPTADSASFAPAISPGVDGPPTASIQPSRHTDIAADVARATTWGFAGRTILLLVNFLSTPFLIRLLGPSAYGIWALIQTVFLWTGFAEGGMGIATTKYTSESYALDDAYTEVTVVWSGLLIVSLSTCTVALLASLAAPHLLHALNVQRFHIPAASSALRLAAVTFVLSSLALTLNSVQQARLRWRAYTLLNIATNGLASVGAPIAVYLSGDGLQAAAIVGLISAALYAGALAWNSYRAQPLLRRPRITLTMLRTLLTYGSALTAAGLISVPLTTGERFFLSADRSTQQVAYYAVALTIATTLHIIPEQLIAPLVPALSRLEAEAKLAEHRALYRLTLAAMFTLISPLTLFIALLARPFLSLWAGPSYGHHSTGLLLICLVGVWLNSFAWLPWTYFVSSGNARIIAWVQLAELVPYLLFAWFATAQWGAIGAAAVWSGRLAIDGIILLSLTKHLHHLPILALPTRSVRALLLLGLLGLTCLGIASITASLFPRTLLGATMLVAYGGALWRFVLTSAERRSLVSLIRRVMPARFCARYQPAHAAR